MKKSIELKKALREQQGIKANGHWNTRATEKLITEIMKARSSEERGRLQAKSE